ncbi:MAG: MFS transporter [Thermoplasmata archaeon]|jgi:MFS family permease
MGTRSGRAKGLSAGLTFNVYLLGLVSLLTDLSSEMVFPLIPFFLLTELGATVFIFGIFEGARESTGSLLKVFSGHWSDRIGRRKGLVIAGYSVSAAMKAAIPFVRVWPELMVAGVMERVGKGLRDAPRDAVLADTAPAEARGKVFGFHRLLDTLGAVLGPLIAFVLLDAFGLPFREIFLLAVGPALVSALLTVFIRERARKPKDAPSLRMGFATLSPALRRFILIATVFALGHFSVLFLLLRVVGVGLTEGTGILFYVAFNLAYALAAFPVGILSDRLGRPPIILVGYLAFAFMAGGLILLAEAWQILFLFVLFGLSSAFVIAVERAFVADLAPPNLRATALGTYHTLTGVARFPASAVAGFLWIVTPAASFAYGLVLALLASLLLTLFMARRSWTTETL